jgi:2,4-dichlorophenol 6-monooxygenase
MRRARLREFFDTLRMEFGAADIELGFAYGDSPAVVADGTPAPLRDAFGHHYIQTSRPGHRLPHAWFERRGQRVAAHDLLRPGAFLLLAGDRGEDWVAAAERAATTAGITIDAHRVGPDGELRGADDAWYGLRGHDARGALLVRPDGHVGFRAPTGVADPDTALERALDTLLSRPGTVDPAEAVALEAGQ